MRPSTPSSPRKKPTGPRARPTRPGRGWTDPPFFVAAAPAAPRPTRPGSRCGGRTKRSGTPNGPATPLTTRLVSLPRRPDALRSMGYRRVRCIRTRWPGRSRPWPGRSGSPRPRGTPAVRRCPRRSGRCWRGPRRPGRRPTPNRIRMLRVEQFEYDPHDDTGEQVQAGGVPGERPVASYVIGYSHPVTGELITLRVSADRARAGEWLADLPEMGVKYESSPRGRSRVWDAIRETSGHAEIVTMYQSTGWHDLGERGWAYVHAGGGDASAGVPVGPPALPQVVPPGGLVHGDNLGVPGGFPDGVPHPGPAAGRGLVLHAHFRQVRQPFPGPGAVRRHPQGDQFPGDRMGVPDDVAGDRSLARHPAGLDLLTGVVVRVVLELLDPQHPRVQAEDADQPFPAVLVVPPLDDRPGGQPLEFPPADR